MSSLSITDCYRLLEVREGTTSEEIKKNYRRLAFRLHPDLNPDDSGAARKFQQLNEAYVILKEHIDSGAAGPKAGPRPGPQPGSGPQAKARPQASATQARSAKREQAKPQRNTYAAGNARFRFKEEEILRDILKDPFARKVFEDIYAQVKKDGKGRAPALKKRKLELNWGEKKMSFDLSQGVVGGIKSWMKGQLDDEHTAHFPASTLVPGRTIRIRIRHGLKNEEKYLEVRLPSDFAVGRPLRLKGLGRKLGPFKGDLYLKLLPKQ